MKDKLIAVILYRARKRSTLEMEMYLAYLNETNLAGLSEAELQQLLELLDLPDALLTDYLFSSANNKLLDFLRTTINIKPSL